MCPISFHPGSFDSQTSKLFDSSIKAPSAQQFIILCLQYLLIFTAPPRLRLAIIVTVGGSI